MAFVFSSFVKKSFKYGIFSTNFIEITKCKKLTNLCKVVFSGSIFFQLFKMFTEKNQIAAI